MTLDELREKYGNSELKEGFEDFIVKPKTGKVFDGHKIKDGELVWGMSNNGIVYNFNWIDNSSSKYSEMKQGNVFYDEKSAREETKRRRVYHAVEKYAYKFSIEEWEKGCDKYIPCFDHETNEITINVQWNWQFAELYFKSEEDIRKAIAEVGEEDFIKYYLGVEL